MPEKEAMLPVNALPLKGLERSPEGRYFLLAKFRAVDVRFSLTKVTSVLISDSIRFTRRSQFLQVTEKLRALGRI
jgi:hypothetical protein